MPNVQNKVINPTAASLLGFLHEGPMTAWDLAEVAKRRIGGSWNITRSQIYREVNALSNSGMVKLGERGQRDKREITLTQKGRETFAKWLTQDPAEEIIRFPLLLSVSFADHLPFEDIKRFVAAHQPIHEARLAAYRKEYDKVAQSGAHKTSGASMTFAFGIQYEEMVLRWMQDILAGQHSKL